MCRGEPAQHVRGAAAGRQAQRDVVGPTGRGQRPGEHQLEPDVVGERRENGAVVHQRQRGERARRRLWGAEELGGRFGIGRTPAVAEREQPSAVLESVRHGLAHTLQSVTTSSEGADPQVLARSHLRPGRCREVDEKGADVWYELTAKELLPEGFACPDCGGREFEKEKDILDVWFDSGSSHAAVLGHRPDLPWPADVYLEGSDQHRGWFHSSLLVGVATRGRAPYKQVITHGFTVDAQGRKISKSVGNDVTRRSWCRRRGRRSCACGSA